MSATDLKRRAKTFDDAELYRGDVSIRNRALSWSKSGGMRASDSSSSLNSTMSEQGTQPPPAPPQAPRLFRSNSDRIKQVVAVEDGGSSLKRSGSERWRKKPVLRPKQETVVEPDSEEPKERATTTSRFKQFWNSTIKRKKKDRPDEQAAVADTTSKPPKSDFFKSKTVNPIPSKAAAMRLDAVRFAAM